MSDAKVRVAQVEDMSTVCKMINAFISEEGDSEYCFTVKQLEEDGFGEDKKFECLVAEIDLEIVAYLLYFPMYDTINGGPSLFIMDLYVRPEMRNRKIGQVLMSELAKDAKMRNCAALYWGVYEHNVDTIRFYDRLGAKDTEAKIFEISGDALERLSKAR